MEMTQMTKLGESLLKGATEALKHAKGEKVGAKTHQFIVPKQVNIKAIRRKLHLTQKEFANRYGFSIRTLEKWEQGVRQPDVAARAYLVVIAKNHRAVDIALR
jgi:putative transcriptional regulator